MEEALEHVNQGTMELEQYDDCLVNGHSTIPQVNRIRSYIFHSVPGAEK